MPADKDDKSSLTVSANSAEVDAFLQKVAAMPSVRTEGGRGRLIFAMDATASRQPSWDRAAAIQGEMFEVTAALGGLDVQLVFYRGYKECKASRWMTNAASLHAAMEAVSCVGGNTQILRVLRHTLNEAAKHKIGAVVFVGDAMEEAIDELCALAGQLGLQGVPVMMFQEGTDAAAMHAFKEIARLSRGAYCPFNANSAAELRVLLGAVAAYAAGGQRALANYGQRAGGPALLLARQLGGGS